MNELHLAIKKYGEPFEIWTTWEKAHESEKKGIFINSIRSSHSWFFIKESKEIWYLTYDSSDGGSWNVRGPCVTGYRAPYNSDIKEIVLEILSAEESKDRTYNSYSKLRYK
ncbi:hypothetical protein ACNTOD_004006 [Vibrio navarrensis]